MRLPLRRAVELDRRETSCDTFLVVFPKAEVVLFVFLAVETLVACVPGYAKALGAKDYCTANFETCTCYERTWFHLNFDFYCMRSFALRFFIVLKCFSEGGQKRSF